jgi:hypothetical protein
LTNTLTWYDTPLSVTVPVSASTTKFAVSAQLVGENSHGYSYPFACRITATHTATDGTVTELTGIVGADDENNTGYARTPVTVQLNGMYENQDAVSTEESFTVPTVVHTPNVNNGTVTYLMQIWNNGTTTAPRDFYVNRTVNDGANPGTSWERSISYITALPVT